ncbi:DUF5995 family protein [Geodermatophilus sabuli]|uniref:Uncharacterized protein n=1 Tax=Geodermatophilus sabuli TaxID=1564158 RepID=A0A285E7Y2_9ACTN|nr:DUF5995 family protein [Geodermatophilus sabuli]MBB3081899.1 hypothetical protein [Geodermatophilus sabuli]SNX95229.1 hypothetical protein SAMN06893097_1011037 [Geodermatophilus sabuli]
MGSGIHALVSRMEGLLAPLQAAHDPLRFFLGVYLRTTVAVAAAIRGGEFEDPAWVEEWDVDFAGLYLDALAAHRRDPAAPPRPWRLAFGARPGLPPEAHVLLGMNAHINYDLPQSLVRVIPPAGFDDPGLRELRRRDHERIDRVLAARVAVEDAQLHRDGGRRTCLDRLLSPANRTASQVLLRESRRKVWANAGQLDAARREGPAAYARRVADLESAAAARVDDLLRPGPVLLRLAVRGFGVTLS